MMHKAAALVTLVLTLAACGGKEAANTGASDTSAANTTTTAAPEPPPPTDTAPVLSAEAAAGQPIYNSRCASCHGEDGNTPKPPSTVKLTEERIRKIPNAEAVKFLLGPQSPAMVAAGHKGAMLTADEANLVVAYMKELK
jgi:mono/diheme cytochrome c family protein